MYMYRRIEKSEDYYSYILYLKLSNEIENWLVNTIIDGFDP